MPVPKRKTARSRRDKRRAEDRLTQPGTSRCPRCREERRPHHVCPSCGFYKDFDVLHIEG